MTRETAARRNRLLVFAGVSGAWLLFTLLALAIAWGGSEAKGRPFDLLNSAIWNMGWLLWIGGTYIVRWLTRRFPIERHALVRRLLLHGALSLLVATVVLSAEYLITFVLERTWPATVLIYLPLVFVAYKIHIYALVYWVIAGACGTYDYYMRLQQTQLTASQLEAELAQAQVQALKMQLHPHFLFNTHHSIISLMLNKDTPGAIKMLTRLSDLLRVTLKQSDQALTSLREELHILDLYLGIQRERYRERLTVDIDIDSAVLDAEVPSLLLQPLVENALEHGIDPQGSGGRLSITGERRDDEIILTVRDNGPGLPEGFVLGQDDGVGLGNTRARLERLYGSRHRFELLSASHGGTKVRVTLPYRRALAPPSTSRTTHGSPA